MEAQFPKIWCMCIISLETVDSQSRSLCFDGGVLGFKACLKRQICCQHILVLFQCLQFFVVLVSFSGQNYIVTHYFATKQKHLLSCQLYCTDTDLGAGVIASPTIVGLVIFFKYMVECFCRRLPLTTDFYINCTFTSELTDSESW